MQRGRPRYRRKKHKNRYVKIKNFHQGIYHFTNIRRYDTDIEGVYKYVFTYRAYTWKKGAGTQITILARNLEEMKRIFRVQDLESLKKQFPEHHFKEEYYLKKNDRELYKIRPQKHYLKPNHKE